MKLLFAPGVLEEVAEIAEYLNSESAGRGDRLVRSLDTVFDRLSVFPYSAGSFHEETRRTPMRPFPYSVIYRVRDDEEAVLVGAVIHDARDPELGRNRAEKL